MNEERFLTTLYKETFLEASDGFMSLNMLLIQWFARYESQIFPKIFIKGVNRLFSGGLLSITS